MSNKFKDEELKKAFGSFATGVAVASSHSNGFTINSFSSLSLDPPLIIFNIYKSETDHVDFLKTGFFAINILSDNQKDFIDFVLSKYVEGGVEELDINRLSDLIVLKYKALQDGEKILGNPEGIKNMFVDFQKHLY